MQTPESLLRYIGKAVLTVIGPDLSSETAEELLLFADVPGVKPEDVDVRFENGELILHARCNPRGQAANFLLNEYEVGDFYRVFALSESMALWAKAIAPLK